MGITTMKRWTAMAALVISAIFTNSLVAQAPIKLLDYNNSVRYSDLDTDYYGTAPTWIQRTYIDTSWKSGTQLLAYETDGWIAGLLGTTLIAPTAYNPSGHATYFRAHFTWSSPNRAILTLSNRLDDGAVFYLNGVEIQRIRVAAGTVTHTTGASATATENTVDVFTYSATNLVIGDNVLAVSVHQSGTGSSDTVYGTQMWGEIIQSVSIITQPTNIAAQVNDSVSFTVGATGTAPTYQWQYRATTNVPFSNAVGASATTDTYTIPTVTMGSAGYYQVIVANAQNTVTSSVVTLTVSSDTSPPELLSAVASKTTNHILVYFNENVSTLTATNLNNYIVTAVGSTNRLVVTNAAVNARVVRIMVSPMWTPGSSTNYILTVNNVCDALGTVIVPGSSIGISFWKDDVLPIDTMWDYSYGTSLDGQNWQARSYNVATNAAWQSPKPALFYNLYGMVASYPGPENTDIDLTSASTCFYFRTALVLSNNVTGNGTISINQIIDDGGVVYVNGEEVYSYNMPAARPTSFGMLAVSERGAGPIPAVKSSDIPVTNLLPGTNIIAAEMHPYTLNPPTIFGACFGISIDAAIPPSTPTVTEGPRPDLTPLGIGTPATMKTNDNISYTVTLTNIGNAVATNVQFTAAFPTNLSVLSVPAGCVNAAGMVTCTSANIAATQAANFVIQAKGVLTNFGLATVRLTVLQTPADRNYFNNTNAISTLITNAVAAPDISVVASTSPAVVGVSSNINFSFTVTNNGITAATAVMATNTLPPGVTVVAATLPAGCVNASGIVTCTIGTMNANTAQTRTIQVIPSVTGTLTNRVVVGSTPADVNTANNSAQSTVIVSPKPQMISFKPGTGNVSFSWQSLVGVTYVIDYKPLLTTPTWTPVLTNTGTGGIMTTTPPIPSPTSPTRFYRLRAQ